MKKLFTIDMFTKVFTIVGLVAVLVYGINWAGTEVVIMSASEFDQTIGSASLEADADTLHALKAQGQE